MVRGVLGTRRVCVRSQARGAVLGAVWLALIALANPLAAGAVGADISYPACGTTYAPRQAFGIVGVNGGRPGIPNPCLASELNWALESFGFDFAFEPFASLYLNTADPGPGTRQQRIADWPHSARSPRGACHGDWSVACAYLYGRLQAARAFEFAALANAPVAADSPWWLDVERANSWAKRRMRDFAQLNISAIHGFIDGLRSSGAAGPVGIYSTPADWLAITAMPSTVTRTYFSSLPDWVGGAATPTQAAENCTVSFSGGPTLLAQYVDGPFDLDLTCP